MKITHIATLIASLLLISACASDHTKVDRNVGSWQVKTFTPKKGTTLCYAGTTPESSKSTVDKRENPYLMITRRASGRIEVSASGGYNFKPASKAKLTVISEKKQDTHMLFTKGNVAWATNDDEDKAIIAELKKAKSVEVSGWASKKATSTDSYSAAGFTGALSRVRELCP